MTSTQMRAAVLMAHSSPLQIGSVLRPTATDGQVLVRIKASAVNPLDLKIHKDRRRMRGIRRLEPPC
jgi:NADPH:quinone reductase